MRSTSWAALLRHIPVEQHDGLMLVTRSGQEININSVLRVDQEFLAFRGRLAASQESGRLFFVPYSNIDYFGYQKPTKDADFHETFGAFAVPEPVAAANGEAAPAATAAAARATPSIKSAALERFRSRANGAPGAPLAPTTAADRPQGER